VPTLSNLTKREFPGASLVTERTKWYIDVQSGALYFSSGNKVYRYNPATPSNAPEQMMAEIEGEVTMLKLRLFQNEDRRSIQMIDFNTLEVGTDGHLYQLDLTGTVGNRGTIKREFTFPGAPADIYNRVTE
jgi:hypothetical protein